MHNKRTVSSNSRNVPHTTYRIQFHKDFNFVDFQAIIPYLRELGIDTVYASPILQAKAGSLHGYDSTDMNQLNSELGTTEDLRRIKKLLDKYNIKWLQDIVPNHMAFHTTNAWLMNLLEFGKASTYSDFFDTCYSSNLFEKGKLMVPFLGKTVNEAIGCSELKVVHFNGRLWLSCHGQSYTLRPESYCFILDDHLHATHEDFNGLLVQINTIQATGDHVGWDGLRMGLLDGLSDKEINDILKMFNDDFEGLQTLVDSQYYELCPWWESNKRINFRRFFTVNELICMNVQDPQVFAQTHSLIQKLVSEGLIDGLRIDHIDGLYNPTNYLMNLRELVGSKPYIVVEKILGEDEELPRNWPVQGTTGYEFLSTCNNLCTNKSGKKNLDLYYNKLVGSKESLIKIQHTKKCEILENHMQGELDNLVRLLEIVMGEMSASNISDVKAILKAFLALFPVYRLYDDHFPLAKSSFLLLSSLFEKMTSDRKLDQQLVRKFRLLFEDAQQNPTAVGREQLTEFLLRCMQLSGPVMAKGVEDTLMYTYNRFIGHNEVGDHPRNFGLSTKKFHKLMRQRQKYWPLSMNASSTHDTKRGEDARSRLSVLTAMSQKWIKQVQIWQDIVWNEYRSDLPHPNDEYFIYQTLIASYPMEKQEGSSDESFEKRLLAYLIKYLREGKERSSWENPNLAYESTVQEFASFLLDKDRPFFKSFYQFIAVVADYGILNSLTQQILKFTCPGVPDIYQGSELWNFSFVDPDNRRSVNYLLHKEYLDAIASMDKKEQIQNLWHSRHDGKIKLWLVQRLAKLRKDDRTLAGESSYIALKVSGRYRKHILAFARRNGDDWLAVIVPLHLAALGKVSKFAPCSFDWSDTTVHLAANQEVKWKHLIAEDIGEGKEIELNRLFKELPLAILKYKVYPSQRSAGILMHVSSLPSPYGIGDLGPEARRFIDQLHQSGQTWWQMLPLGPTDSNQCHSPYSTLSSRAGNPLFIDLKDLVKMGLLEGSELKGIKRKFSLTIDFDEVKSSKNKLLEKAFDRLPPELNIRFTEFLQNESSWLDDYALFKILKMEQGNRPWYEWNSLYRLRDKAALTEIAKKFNKELQREKWIQYIFYSQWDSLRRYAKDHGVRFMGDVPYYVAHDSVDVWVNPKLFSLTDDGKLRTVAGVPPDYFNEDGQLWGMPVYNWSALKETGYRWWIDRLAHNCRLFDQVRLDHFRAFAAFWEVSVDADSAKHGQWITGPGIDFFDRAKDELGNMPFVAEDLGDIDAAVYKVRDHYNLPGMAVLQFAFGKDMTKSPHIPHQYSRTTVAYTGTHDNNTNLSWYNQDLSQSDKSRISKYFGRSIDSSTINNVLIRSLYASVADIVIVPMQDILNLDGSCRMNRPASTTGNWLWRIEQTAYCKSIQNQLYNYTKIYNR